MKRHRWTLTRLALACCIPAMINTPPAHATTGHYLNGSFGATGPGSTLSTPTGIAVDPTNGDIYLAEQGTESILKFDATGHPIPTPQFTTITTTPTGPGGTFVPFVGLEGITIDPLTRDFYVGDLGAGVVYKFTANGTYISSITTTPSGPFNFASSLSLGIDPVNGNLYVATINGVFVFDPSGVYLRSIPGVAEPLDVAVDQGGNIYVADQGVGLGSVVKFDSLGNSLGVVDSSGSQSVVVNPVTGDVYVGGLNVYGANAFGFDEYDSLGRFVFRFGCGNVQVGCPNDYGTTSGIAVNPVTNVVYVSNDGEGRVDVYDPFTLGPPGVIPPSFVSNVGRATVVLRGVVNPGGFDTRYHFEYGTDLGYGGDIPQAGVSVGSGGADVAVNQILNGLRPGTAYHFRLVAENSQGSVAGPDQTFITLPPTPALAATGEPSSIGLDTVTLTGSANAGGLASSYHFDIGLDTAYGIQVWGNAGISPDTNSISESIAGLRPETTYHYRLVVSNTNGASYGQDHTFTTLGYPPLITQPVTAMLIPVSPETQVELTSTRPVNPKKPKKPKKSKKKAKKAGKAKKARKARLVTGKALEAGRGAGRRGGGR